MTGWIIAVALYLIGYAGLSAMGRDLSTQERSTLVRVRLLAWPAVVAWGWLGDQYDRMRS